MINQILLYLGSALQALPSKLCPAIFTISSILILVGSLI